MKLVDMTPDFCRRAIDRGERISERVAAGATPEQIAEEFGIALGAARIHCGLDEATGLPRRAWNDFAPALLKLSGSRRGYGIYWRTGDDETVRALLKQLRIRVRDVRACDGGNAADCFTGSVSDAAVDKLMAHDRSLLKFDT